MFWILIGGTCLLVLIVAGVLPALFGGKSPAPPVADSAPRMPVALPDKPEALPPADTRRADAAFLAAAEPLARKFLEASRIEDMLPVVRNPNVAQARMRRYYPGGKIEPPGMTEINKETDIFRSGTIAIIKVRTRSHEEKPLACAETPQGIKIDWESWVGWSEMSWEDFLASKPTTGQVFRLVLSPVDYYNFAFTSDSKWQAYQLTSPDGAHLLYGYAERGTAMNSQLRPALDIPQAALMLSLKFPENAASNNQVLIEKLVAEGWVLESEDPP